MLDVRSDRAPGWTAGHRSLHRGDLYLTHTDAALRRRRSVRYDAAVNGLDDGPAPADCPEHQGDQEKQKHDEKYDRGDSHGGGGDRSTLII
jgi:hypothetical protein